MEAFMNYFDLDENKSPIKERENSFVKTILISVVVSIVVSTGVFYTLNRLSFKGKVELNENTAPVVLSSSDFVAGNVSQIAKKIGPSIVGIKISSPVDTIFGVRGYDEAEGSGIIVANDGYIVTNYHVVEAADPKNKRASPAELTVFLSDEKEAKAKFIGGDVSKDIAVIKIEEKNLTPAELGDSSALEVGELAVAVGNPLGMEFAGSVTVGYISALNRTMEINNETFSLIQTDAAINPGNSGGALVNAYGQVIGINTVKISVSGVEGLGFAIPINDVKDVIKDLIEVGYVRGKPFIGISGRSITKEMSEWYQMPEGIYVLSVTKGSSADNVGIKRGDIIIELNGKKVVTHAELEQEKNKFKAGDKVVIKFIRGDQEITKDMVLSEDRVEE
jgi:serine protease Do